jgi:membrane protease YdiL (CAAX protease family)
MISTMNKKWLAPVLPYLAVWAGLFLFNSAWGALIGFHLAILFSLFVFRASIPMSLLFKSNYPKWILASIIVCGLSGIGLYLFWGMFGIYNNLPEQLESIGLRSSSWFPFITYFSLVNPFAEEYFWRGFLGSDTKISYAGDFVYAGYHAIILWGKIQPMSVLFALILLTAAGWFWRQIYRDDEGLLAPVLGHAAADFTILVCLYLQTK